MVGGAARHRIIQHAEQACVQLHPTSADNVALLAFASVRRAAAAPGDRALSIDIVRLAHSHTPLQRQMGQTDRRTDTVPLHKSRIPLVELVAD